MSQPVTLAEVADLAAQLPPEEQKQLAQTLLSRLASPLSSGTGRRTWRDVRGSLPYPSLGEDAQAWVNRTRQESDAERAEAPGGKP